MTNILLKNRQVYKYSILIILFCISSFSCYSQKNNYFDLYKKFSYPNVLRISVKIEEHERIPYVEEYLIHTKSLGNSNFALKMYVYTINLNLETMSIDTVLLLQGTEMTYVENFCNYIYKNKIPNEYHGETIEMEPSGVFVTYTMEIAGEKYTFTDRRLLSLATLVLYNKNNWYNVLLDTDN